MWTASLLVHLNLQKYGTLVKRDVCNIWPKTIVVKHSSTLLQAWGVHWGGWCTICHSLSTAESFWKDAVYRGSSDSEWPRGPLAAERRLCTLQKDKADCPQFLDLVVCCTIIHEEKNFFFSLQRTCGLVCESNPKICPLSPRNFRLLYSQQAASSCPLKQRGLFSYHQQPASLSAYCLRLYHHSYMLFTLQVLFLEVIVLSGSNLKYDAV